MTISNVRVSWVMIHVPELQFEIRWHALDENGAIVTGHGSRWVQRYAEMTAARKALVQEEGTKLRALVKAMLARFDTLDPTGEATLLRVDIVRWDDEGRVGLNIVRYLDDAEFPSELLIEEMPTPDGLRIMLNYRETVSAEDGAWASTQIRAVLDRFDQIARQLRIAKVR